MIKNGLASHHFIPFFKPWAIRSAAKLDDIMIITKIKLFSNGKGKNNLSLHMKNKFNNISSIEIWVTKTYVPLSDKFESLKHLFLQKEKEKDPTLRHCFLRSSISFNTSPRIVVSRYALTSLSTADNQSPSLPFLSHECHRQITSAMAIT